MKKISFRISLAYIMSAIIALFFAQDALAQLIQSEITAGNDFGVGARAMGMGGAFIGVADDFTALHWNPAGLSQIKRAECFGGLSHEKLGTETEYYGSSDSTFSSRTRLNSLGLVLPVPVYQGGLAFAFGVNRLQSYDFRVGFKGFNEESVEENYEFGQLSINELHDESGGIYSWSFGGAVEIARGVSLGGALSFLSGDYDYELELDADDTKNLDSKLTGFSYRDAISSEYFGVEGKMGLLARPVNQLSLGLTLGVPLSFSADEYWRKDSFYSYDDGTSESDFDPEDADWNNLSYDISQPFRFGVGIAAYPLPGAILAADVRYTDWTQTEYSETPAEDISEDVFKEDYRGTAQFHVGGEYTIPNAGVRIRAGYIFDPTPYAPDSMKIEKERQFITLGLGMIMEEVFSLDLAYLRGWWDESTEDEIIKSDHAFNRIFLSCGYKF